MRVSWITTKYAASTLPERRSRDLDGADSPERHRFRCVVSNLLSLFARCVEPILVRILQGGLPISNEPGSPEAVDEIGDVLFTIVNLARKQGIDAETIKTNLCQHNPGLKGCDKKLSGLPDAPAGRPGAGSCGN